MPVVEILIGLPASGKSLYARKKVKQDPQWLRFSRNFFRGMLTDGRHSPGSEEFIVKMRNYVIKQALMGGYNVILDGVNLEETVRKLKVVVDSLPFPVEVIENDSFLKVPLKEVLERNKSRYRPLDEAVIQEYYLEFEERIKKLGGSNAYTI